MIPTRTMRDRVDLPNLKGESGQPFQGIQKVKLPQQRQGLRLPGKALGESAREAGPEYLRGSFASKDRA